jgi:HKD family nuclease
VLVVQNLEIKFFRKLSEGLVQLRNPLSKNLDIAVAFVRNDGIDLIDSLGFQVSRGVIGDAFNTTEPDAIDRLRRQANSEVRIAEVEGGIFHPKVYLMDYDGSLAAFVGSANLTRGGIQTNEEASLVLRGDKKEPPIPGLLEYFDELWKVRSVEVTDEWMNNYRSRFEQLPKDRLVTEQQGSRIARSISLTVAENLASRASNHWVVVTTPENYRICLANGLWGVNRQVATIQEVHPGDVVTFYVKGWKNFRGVYRVTGAAFYDAKLLWPGKPYPWRVKIQPTSQAGSTSALELRKELGMIKNPSVWGTYFEREMIRVSNEDFAAIINRMKSKF